MLSQSFLSVSRSILFQSVGCSLSCFRPHNKTRTLTEQSGSDNKTQGEFLAFCLSAWNKWSRQGHWLTSGDSLSQIMLSFGGKLTLGGESATRWVSLARMHVGLYWNKIREKECKMEKRRKNGIMAESLKVEEEDGCPSRKSVLLIQYTVVKWWSLLLITYYFLRIKIINSWCFLPHIRFY